METPVDHADADQASEPAGPPSRADVLAHLARILESREFRAARNRARFLEYVITRTLDGADHGLKEYTIGVEVFDRGEAFDPRTDGVVRTQAGLVRKHLERYYATEGREDEIEIVLPKGHYVPVLQRRAAAVPADAAHAGVNGAGPGSEAAAGGGHAEGHPAVWSERAGAGVNGGRRRLALAGAIAATVAVAVVIGALVWRTGALTRGPSAPAASAAALAGDDSQSSPIWRPFLAPGASTVLAFGIPQFFSGGGGLWVRDTTINVPTPDFPRRGGLDVISREIGPLQPAEAYTGIGEAYGVYLLSRFFLGRAHDLRVVRSPTLSWDNLKQDNVIFLTSARFKTLADQLSYPSEFAHAVGQPNRVLNLHPQPGEEAEYVTRTIGPVSIDHAIVSMWPGKLPGRRVLVLSGGHTWGTQAAAEYVTEPGYLRELHGHLQACQQRQGLSRHPEFFQVLLRVEIRDNQTLGVRYVTHRDLAISETGEPADVRRAALAPRTPPR